MSKKMEKSAVKKRAKSKALNMAVKEFVENTDSLSSGGLFSSRLKVEQSLHALLDLAIVDKLEELGLIVVKGKAGSNVKSVK